VTPSVIVVRASCAECTVISPVTDLLHEEHFGGFYRCRDRTACNLRVHLGLCRLIRSFGNVNRSCMFCMSGSGHVRVRGALIIRVAARSRHRITF
jgi:hypothetical protein